MPFISLTLSRSDIVEKSQTKKKKMKGMIWFYCDVQLPLYYDIQLPLYGALEITLNSLSLVIIGKQ